MIRISLFYFGLKVCNVHKGRESLRNLIFKVLVNYSVAPLAVTSWRITPCANLAHTVGSRKDSAFHSLILHRRIFDLVLPESHFSHIRWRCDGDFILSLRMIHARWFQLTLFDYVIYLIYILACSQQAGNPQLCWIWNCNVRFIVIANLK